MTTQPMTASHDQRPGHTTRWMRQTIDRQIAALELYRAKQEGCGRYATDKPYPLKRWSQMSPAYRRELLKRAERFAALDHLDLPERFFTAWWEPAIRAGGVKPWADAKPWMRDLWTCVAEAYAEHEQEADAA